MKKTTASSIPIVFKIEEFFSTNYPLNSNSNIILKVKNNTGGTLATAASLSTPTVAVSFFAGSQYYFYISSSSVEYANYTLQIT